jgi:hypothetical protein
MQSGDTPLLVAACEGQEEVVELLISYRAKLNVTSKVRVNCRAACVCSSSLVAQCPCQQPPADFPSLFTCLVAMSALSRPFLCVPVPSGCAHSRHCGTGTPFSLTHGLLLLAVCGTRAVWLHATHTSRIKRVSWRCTSAARRRRIH